LSKKKKESTALTAASTRVQKVKLTADSARAQRVKMVKKPEMMMTKKKKQKTMMSAIPRPLKSAVPTNTGTASANKQYPVSTSPWAPPIGTPFATATTGGYGQFPVAMNNAHYAIPTGPAGPYYPY